MRSWSVILAQRVIINFLNMCMLNLNFKILCEILVCHTAWGVNHLFTMCMLNLNFKILGEILVCHTAWGVNHLLTMCMMNINM